MIKYSLAFLAGNVLIHQFSQLNTGLFLQLFYFVIAIVIALFILGYFSKSYQYKIYFYTVILMCLFFSVSFFSSYYYVKNSLAQGLPEQIEAKEIIVQAYIDSIPIENDRSIKFTIKLKKVLSPKSNYSDQIVRVSWYTFSNKKSYKKFNKKPFFPKKTQQNKFKVGDFWQFKLKLKRPSGLLNPGTMDYEKWLFAHKIRAVGYIRKGAENKLLASNLLTTNSQQRDDLSWQDRANYSLNSLRQKLSDKLNVVLADNPFKGIYLALSLGLKDQITAEQWRVFLDTGTNHLIAISGLHIGLFATIGFFIGLRLWSLSALLLKRVPAQQAAALLALIFALIYAALAGFSIPTQRALIMVSLALSSIILRLRFPPSLILSYALIFVLLIDPLASLSIGFWLSFTAVGVILFSISSPAEKNLKEQDNDDISFEEISTTKKINNKLINVFQFITQISRLQLIIFLGLLPFTLLFFSRLSLLSPIANLIAVPWMSLVVTPLVLLATAISTFSIELSTWIYTIISYLMQPLWLFLNYLAEFEQNIIYPDIENSLIIVPSMLGIFLFFSFKSSPKRWFALVLLLPLLIPNSALWTKLFSHKIPQGEFKLSVLDVGQGLSVVIQTQNHVLVYDTGNSFSPRFDMANQVVIPFLRHQSIAKIDTLILSHADHDHVGAAPSLLATYKADEILTGEPKRLKFKLDISAEQCLQGQKWIWDQVQFEVLYPTIDILTMTRKSNNLSCVVLVTSLHGERVLLTGDIEKKVEQKFKSLPILKSLLKNVDIVIAPHHGSKSSSSQAFVNILKPKLVIFTNGYLNRYHFPANQVVERYREQNSRVFSTQNGLIELTTGTKGQQIKVTEYRKDNHHYWNRDYKALQ